MTRYAADTSTSSERSRAEIERTLKRYGADSFAYGWEDGAAVIGFRAHGRKIRFTLPALDLNEREYTHVNRNSGPTMLSKSAREDRIEQAMRQRWRALALVVKAKLEAVESGITDFESEFLAHIILPNGRTMGETYIPQIAHIYETGKIPALMGGVG